MPSVYLLILNFQLPSFLTDFFSKGHSNLFSQVYFCFPLIFPIFYSGYTEDPILYFKSMKKTFFLVPKTFFFVFFTWSQPLFDGFTQRTVEFLLLYQKLVFLKKSNQFICQLKSNCRFHYILSSRFAFISHEDCSLFEQLLCLAYDSYQRKSLVFGNYIIMLYKYFFLMTDIIDTILLDKPQLNAINLKGGLKHPAQSIINGLAGTYQRRQQLNSFQVIIKQIHCPYDLLVIINPQNVFTMLKVSMLQKSGNLLKIPEQHSKTYLIRKFLTFDSIYRLQIDPFSGEIYFRLDYFELNTFSSPMTKNQLRQIFQSLNLSKLYQTVEKFISFYQSGQLNSSKDNNNLSIKNQYQQLVKAICSMDSSDVLHHFKQSSFQRENENLGQQSQQLIEIKAILAKLEQYFVMQNQGQKEMLDRKLLKKQLKQIELENIKLGSLAKKKGEKGNLEVLRISKDTEKKMKEVLKQMIEEKVPKHIMKIVQNEMGNLVLNFQRQHDLIYQNKIQFLSNMPKDIEYTFLDKYFTMQGCSWPILITTCLKEKSLDCYLSSNSITLSIQTKMRVLLHIFNAVHSLWEDRQILLYITGFQKIFLTKSMIIKIRNLNSYDRINMFMMFEDKARVNVKLLDNWLNLSKIYFKLFFNHCLVKPSMNELGEGQFLEYLKPIASAKRLVGTKFLPENCGDPVKQIIMGLNYIFISFIDKAYKMIISFLKKADVSKDFYSDEQQLDKTEDQIQFNRQRLYSYKLTGCWILRNFDVISKEDL